MSVNLRRLTAPLHTVESPQMEFVPEPPATTFSEAVRRRIRSWLDRQGNGPEDVFVQEGAVLRQLFQASEEAYDCG